MQVLEWYVGFWPPVSRPLWARLGHVDIWGYTEDDTWLFIDPRFFGTEIVVTHHHDRVDNLLAFRFANCTEIWRTRRTCDLTFPVIAPFTCVSLVGHVLGFRAFTIAGVRKKLRETGAECIHGRPTGEPG